MQIYRDIGRMVGAEMGWRKEVEISLNVHRGFTSRQRVGEQAHFGMNGDIHVGATAGGQYIRTIRHFVTASFGSPVVVVHCYPLVYATTGEARVISN